jgi:hypothetical protein
VRAGLACYPVILAGGWIATQYWHDRFFSWVVPALVGVACAAAAQAAGGIAGVAVAIPAAVLAVAFSYALVPGGAGLVTPLGQALPPYLAAVGGAAAWPLLVAGPRGR